jgi:hypothetical protein
MRVSITPSKAIGGVSEPHAIFCSISSMGIIDLKTYCLLVDVVAALSPAKK